MWESLEPPCIPPNLVPRRERGECRKHLCWPLREKQVSWQRGGWYLSHAGEYQLLFGALGESYEDFYEALATPDVPSSPVGGSEPPPTSRLPPGVQVLAQEPPPFTIQCLMNDHGFNPKI